MNWLTFISNLVSALAWPTVILVVVILLRRQLTLLLPELTHLRFKDFEIEFEKKIDHLKQEAQKANLPELEQAAEHPPKEVPNVSRIYSDLTNLAEIYPRGAVLEAWGVVEVAAKNALARAGIQTHPDITPTSTTMRKVARLLKTREGMDRNLAQIINELRQLRNSVAHASDVEISTGRAKEYVGLALRVASTLGTLGQWV